MVPRVTLKFRASAAPEWNSPSAISRNTLNESSVMRHIE
jgi:hypothetical protein